MAEVLHTDICVIGGGSGGLSVAAGAVQMGARVVLVEGAAMGGDCLNHGCVPSKALIAAAHAAHAMGAGGPFGVAPVAPEIDRTAVRDHVARVIAGIAPHDSVERFEGLGVRVIRDWARFTDPREVVAGGLRIRARRFVIATGSTPAIPPVPGLAQVPYLTNETVFGLAVRPFHLIVLGGGPIGMEMAQAHRRLGSRVTVIEAGRPLAREEPELAAIVLERLRAEGVEVIEGTAITAVAGTEGALNVTLADGRRVAGSHLLVAAGRRPALERLGLEAAGIAHTDAGVTVDARLRTTNRRAYAIGDAAGQGQFTHLAGYHAGIVIRSAVLGLPARVRTDHIPRATYTDPELAHVGLTEAEARARFGDRVEVVTFPFADNDRARATLRTDGMVKLVIHRGRPIGAGIAGPQAGELIAPWSLAIAQRLRLSAMAGVVLPYPTLAEVGKRAAGAYFSPKLFGNAPLKRVVRLVQRLLP
ncbi:dihydrolipoyl dehydrogenase family protein [Rhodobaculum claviforme]|uniref:Dihydrolipoamide dehydrogenase n=1 Tax=Rhodobaculum claviforme TaxID=1549854 RepID=A0A934WKH0_9RHOB|nr:FAD-dependent oxidoreductase [Rhodobaculum claviforme]MBK5928859.1 dihydrolipoamide dehydrogenase [Rhodobaculum claviforme]